MNKPEVATTDDLISVISGDALRMCCLNDQREIARLAHNIPEHLLVIRPAAVRRVLAALLERDITADQAHTWASFVRRGYVPTREKVVTPIDISYQQDCEGIIVEAVSRLDELGDTIDVRIEDDELRKLIQSLAER